MNDNTTYFWIRVFDYDHERDSWDKGIMLDEFYLKDITSRDEAKRIVKEKYHGQTSAELKFAKPKKTNGIYAIVMDSEKFFYDRFYTTVDTFCFWHNCHKPIHGKIGEFPSTHLPLDEDSCEFDYDNPVYFCSYMCKEHFYKSIRYEGEFQEKEAGFDGDVFGYIYLIYNRVEDMNYIGQTRYMPFFRWQEHIKSGLKGDILDLSFSVLTEVRRNPRLNETENQQYLNSIEAWWISKYKEDGFKVCNISNPKITVEYVKQRFNEMVAKQRSLAI